MKERIQFDFIADNYFSELKEKEIMNERMALLAQMDPYAGKYFSAEYLRRKILRQTDAEFREIDRQMEKEISEGKLIDPMAMPAMEHEQMAMNLQPPQEEEEGIDPADYEKGNV